MPKPWNCPHKGMFDKVRKEPRGAIRRYCLMCCSERSARNRASIRTANKPSSGDCDSDKRRRAVRICSWGATGLQKRNF